MSASAKVERAEAIFAFAIFAVVVLVHTRFQINEKKAELQEKLPRLLPFKVGSKGQLLEWYKEVDGEWVLFDKVIRGVQTAKNGFLMSGLYRGDEKPGSVKVKCVVTDSDGNKAESTAVTVTTSDIAFEEKLPERKNIEVGDKVSFSVKVTGGTKPYTYNWYIGGKQYDGLVERLDLKHDKTCVGYDKGRM